MTFDFCAQDLGAFYAALREREQRVTRTELDRQEAIAGGTGRAAMYAPKMVVPESCAWCDEPKQGHAQHWHPVGGWHGWTPPSKGLIAARMRRNFQIKGLLPTDPMDPAHQALTNSGSNVGDER